MIALSESERVETLRVLLENKCAAAAAAPLARAVETTPPPVVLLPSERTVHGNTTRAAQSVTI
jgi:hypothetical protein